MVTLIAGASHSGKTALAQKLLETCGWPYLSMDHLKMGLIRSGRTDLTPLSEDEALTACLWPVVREMIKTAIENGQNLVVEGCYIPFDWEKDFEKVYLDQMQYLCLVLSRSYIRNHFDKIRAYANVIENRLDDSDCTEAWLLAEHGAVWEQVQKFAVPYALIEDRYDPEALCRMLKA